MWLKLKQLRGYSTGYCAETRRRSSVLTYLAYGPRLVPSRVSLVTLTEHPLRELGLAVYKSGPLRKGAFGWVLRSRRIALGVVVVGVLGAQPCRAASPVLLELEAQDACTTKDAVQAEVLRLLGETEGAEPTQAHVSVEREAEILHLKLEIWVSRERYVREVDVQSCEEATKTAALILALAIRPDLKISEAAPLPPSENSQDVGAVSTAAGSVEPADGSSGAEEAARQAEIAAVAREASPNQKAVAELSEVDEPGAPKQARAKHKTGSESRVLTGTLALGYEASAFALPRVTQGVVLGLGLRSGPLSAEIYGLFQLPVQIGVEGDASRGGEFSEWQLGLRACYIAPIFGSSEALQFEGGACALGEAGQIRAAGFGSGATDSTQGLWGALGGGGQFGLSAGGPVALRVNVSALAPLARDSFEWSSSTGQSLPIATVSEVFARFEVALVIPL
jgi:hypothetical protein